MLLLFLRKAVVISSFRTLQLIVLSVALAAGIRLLLDPFLRETQPYILFIIPALYFSKNSGWLFGAIALFLGLVTANFFFEPHRMSLWVNSPDKQIGLILYLMVGGIGVYLANISRISQLGIEDTKARLAAIVECSEDAIIGETLDGVIRNWNEGAERLFGYSIQEAVGQRISLLIPSEKQDEEKLIIARIHRGERVDHYETIMLTKDGQRREISLTVSPLRNRLCQITGVSLVARDITGQKRSERGHRLFRELIDQSTDGIEAIDPETGGFLDVNEKTCVTHGYSREELLGMSVPDIDPKVAALTWKLMMKGRLTGSQTIETIHRRKNGSTFPVEVNFTTISLDRDYIVAIVRDITDRMKVEETLRRFNQELEDRVNLRTAELHLRTKEFETVVRSIPDTVIRFKENREVVFFKESSYEVIPGLDGCSGTACRSANCLLCSLIADALRVGCESSRYPGTGISEMEVSWGVVELRVTSLVDGDYLVLVRDISVRRKLEKEILNALKKEKDLSEMKSRFISVASHEFRTPLTAVAGSVELLQNFQDKLTPAKRSELLNRIAMGANRLKSIVNDVLILSRTESGKVEAVNDLVNIRDLFADIIDEAKIGDQNKHDLKSTFYGSLESVYTDKKLLHHITSNLLSNAIRYSPERSLIQVNFHGEEEKFWFEVLDQGIGVPEVDQPNLFEPFFRCGNVGQISGTGLGLNIVKRYTELLGGTIQLVPSKKGACFRVAIPMVPFTPSVLNPSL